MKKLRFNRNSLPVLMVAAQVGLVILIALAIGIPSIWSIQRQFGWYAQESLAQSNRTVETLLVERRTNLNNLATLTAQRLTLQRLTQDGNLPMLQEYLENLRSAAGLDLILLCDADRQPITQAGEAAGNSICGPLEPSGFFLDTTRQPPTGFMLASQPVPDSAGSLSVVVGQALDDQYAQELRDWIGLETALFLDDQLLATSFSGEQISKINLGNTLQELVQQGTSFDGSSRSIILESPYYVLEKEDPDSSLAMMYFYPALEIVEAQRELTRSAGLIMLVVILLGSVIGYLGARQISRPLSRLRDAADRLRRGDLTTPINLDSPVANISQVANALEAARSTLLHSQKQLQQEKEWVEYLLEAVVEGILTIDRRGRITFFSQGAERITGWNAEQVLGRALDDVFRIVDEDTRFSQRIPDPGGRQKIVVQLAGERQAILAITRAGGAPPGASKASTVLVLRDVSDEETIRRLLGEFLANIAHEFRTPLSALAASIELLLDQLPGLNPEELSELLNSVHLGVLSLQTLIDNLLEGASIETGRFRVYPKPIDPVEIIREAVRTMEPLAQKYGQSIEVNIPVDLPEARADPRRTGQVLVNLLSNAIKWNPNGGTICLGAIREDERVLITVADQGPGIPDDRQSEVFLRFDRTQTRDGRGESGAGLGLSVVKAIIEAQGGQVGAYNQPDGGAAFWFSIPINCSEAEQEELPG